MLDWICVRLHPDTMYWRLDVFHVRAFMIVIGKKLFGRLEKFYYGRIHNNDATKVTTSSN